MITEKDIDNALAALKTAIMGKSAKTQQILYDWLLKWGRYISRESGFDPKTLPRYKRGDVLYVDFGFNIGAEYGGIHYAVVVEPDNKKSSGNILVVPLTSIEKGKSQADVNGVDVYVGDDVIDGSGFATVAKPNQVRAISKMRIIKPLSGKSKLKRLTGEQLQLIDDKLSEFVSRKSVDK